MAERVALASLLGPIVPDEDAILGGSAELLAAMSELTCAFAQSI